MSDFKVLVVDDENDSRFLMVHYLEEFECAVITAPGGEEGIRAAREHKPDSELKHIPVVIVSILADEGRGRLFGTGDLVTKPLECDDLLRVLWRKLVRNRSRTPTGCGR